MRAAILCIGTELSTNLVKDSNAEFLRNKLLDKGILTEYTMFVPDDKEAIIQALRFLIQKEELRLVVVSGGLGPTEDDITREAVAETLKRELVFLPQAWEEIRKIYFSIRKKEPPENNKKQALIPQGALMLQNRVGTAPGFLIQEGDKKIFVIPGVPQEVEFFWHYIDEQISNPQPSFFKTETLKLCAIGESELASQLQDFLVDLPSGISPAFIPRSGEIWFYLYAFRNPLPEENQKVQQILESIKQRFKDRLFSTYADTLEEAVGQLLREHRLTIATAESCTGGLLANRITNVPGSSTYFKRGYVVYSNQSKADDLNVPLAVIHRHGAVSEEVASLLAQNVAQRAGSDIGVGITGIAGPGGGSELKPVGLVYIGISWGKHLEVHRYQFHGARTTIKFRTTQEALSQLFLLLSKRCLDNGE
ncbi:competence/damage-inducible protein A [Thermatribacter velox]|uniref:CinA-like protein n=1 Tax=Thermatribacter velox TaxID=3039681 RepID=A0ABZ2Y8V8_9BACT